jgi:UDP-2,4-diacetamido-2,4,6-trideoxy-beta-L-altropyranose hydrolase
MDVAFRVDASSKIGTGHLMRCLALAGGLHQRGANVCFVSRHMPDFLQKMIEDLGYLFCSISDANTELLHGQLSHSHWLGSSQHADALATLACLSGRIWDWLIVDHYALDSEWESEMRICSARIMVIDDIADRVHDCDILLDQNLYSDMHVRYQEKVFSSCQLLLGPTYALLKPDFEILRKHTKVRDGGVKRILISFGGVDTANHTGLAIKALKSIGYIEYHVDVVIGNQHPKRKEIEANCVELGFSCHVQTAQMAELIASADMAIGSGGIATWERCCLGLPTIVICAAQNQRQQIEDAARKGLVALPNDFEQNEKSLAKHIQTMIDNRAFRTLLSTNGMSCVDGRGVMRVINKLGISRIEIRNATLEDELNLFDWRNHELIRAASRCNHLIEWNEHKDWIRSVLNSPDSSLLIGTLDGLIIGVVRYDYSVNSAEISIYLVPHMIMIGYGGELMQAAEQWLRLNRQNIISISAYVLGHNYKATKLFTSEGYMAEPTRFIKKL